MNKPAFLWSADQITRLIHVATDLADRHDLDAEQAVAQLADLASPCPKRHRRIGIIRLIDRMRKVRSRRNAQIGADLFRDPAWDMLLDLYSAHQKGEQLSVNALCYGSGVPPTTALRQLCRLEKHKLLTRQVDQKDKRRTWVTPTAKALATVEQAGRAMADALDAAGAQKNEPVTE